MVKFQICAKDFKTSQTIQFFRDVYKQKGRRIDGRRFLIPTGSFQLITKQNSTQGIPLNNKSEHSKKPSKRPEFHLTGRMGSKKNAYFFFNFIRYASIRLPV